MTSLLVRRISTLAVVCALAFLGVGAIGATAGRHAGAHACGNRPARERRSRGAERDPALVRARSGPTYAASFCCRRRTLSLHGRVRLLRARFARRLGVLEAHQTVLRLERLRQVVSRGEPAVVVGQTRVFRSGEALDGEPPAPGEHPRRPLARSRPLGRLRVPAAPGVFGGRNVVIITSDFGVRS